MILAVFVLLALCVTETGRFLALMAFSLAVLVVAWRFLFI